MEPRPSFGFRPKRAGGHAYLTDEEKRARPRKIKYFLILTLLLLAIIAIGLGVGLGIGLTRNGSSSSPSNPPASGNTTSPNPNTTNTGSWQPQVGATWQIVLEYALNDTSADVSVYDIDLFTNPSSTISDLHALNRRVICYFSAGTYEAFRPDSNRFKPSDYANPVDGWPGEYWLDTNSSNVRSIMLARLDLAVQKSCDGVDPDNVDGYDNDTGLNLTTADAIDYVSFLADAAQHRNLSIGLKNAGSIVPQTLGIMQWEVNEQCVQYQECAQFRPFIDAGKPVFHIEYPNSAPAVTGSEKSEFCSDAKSTGFSTILKDMALDDWVEAC
jgi:endo-alpha-1,4-polygalactosaminidase (GH114 family)